MQPTGAVADGVHGDAVVLGKEASDPHLRSDLVLRHADGVLDEILGPHDTALVVHVDAVVAKGSRQKSGRATNGSRPLSSKVSR